VDDVVDLKDAFVRHLLENVDDANETLDGACGSDDNIYPRC